MRCSFEFKQASGLLEHDEFEVNDGALRKRKINAGVRSFITGTGPWQMRTGSPTGTSVGRARTAQPKASLGPRQAQKGRPYGIRMRESSPRRAASASSLMSRTALPHSSARYHRAIIDHVCHRKSCPAPDKSFAREWVPFLDQLGVWIAQI